MCSSLIALALLGLSGCASEQKNETAEYPYYAEIHTFNTSSLTVKLEQGQRFEAQLWAWKEDKLRFMTSYGWRIPTALVFRVEDPYGQRVIDAGPIDYTYEFAFTPEQFITIWSQYLDTGMLIHGYIIDNREFKQFVLEGGYVI